jgi:hypothetical protein
MNVLLNCTYLETRSYFIYMNSEAMYLRFSMKRVAFLFFLHKFFILCLKSPIFWDIMLCSLFEVNMLPPSSVLKNKTSKKRA